jgi:hypothetical protein
VGASCASSGPGAALHFYAVELGASQKAGPQRLDERLN